MVLVGTFAVMIVLGTILLWLPFMQEKPVGFIDCFFISTSAACVTGLVTVDTASSFTFWGELVIMLLIQFGGLGIMTFAAISFKLLGARLSLRNQAALEDTLFQRNAALEFTRTFNYIFIIVFTVELTGAVVLFLENIRHMPVLEAAWSGIFHSVSAFCNAGFSLWSDSLTSQSRIFQIMVMLLIIIGGLGNVVLVELARVGRDIVYRRPKKSFHLFSFHTRTVLLVSCGLIIFGTVVIYFFDPTDSVFDCLFQSVTARTAGFNTFSQSTLSTPAVIIMLFLMFVGGSPGSCAGGIKTTSLAIWLAHIKSDLLHRNQATILERSVPQEIVVRARQLINLALIWNTVGIFILTITEITAPLRSVIFEQISAFGTVGLSMDLTPLLTDPGKLWIIATMFIGRLGPLTIALAVDFRNNSTISHPEGRIMIG